MKVNYLVEGVVVDTSDPQQDGRIKVWCPAVDGERNDSTVANLPWIKLVSPYAGQTLDYPAGAEGAQTDGFMAYGFFAVPKMGATVVVGFLYGDTNKRVYMGSYWRDHGNRSLPTGRNRPDLGVTYPLSDTFDPVQPLLSNLNIQFNGNIDAPEARTRGAYERQVAQDKTIKDGAEGYQKSVTQADLDSQTICLTTPGRHSLIFQDNPENSRVRLKTASGHQVIMDDANERIYISTAKGKSWVELDQDGHIHVYAEDSLSLSTGGDLNMTAAGSVNIHAGKNLNLAAGGHGRIVACSDLSFTGDGGVNITSGAKFDILASGQILQTGSSIHLNGPTASAGPCADRPNLVPTHEPWTRPTSTTTRNKHWKK